MDSGGVRVWLSWKFRCPKAICPDQRHSLHDGSGRGSFGDAKDVIGLFMPITIARRIFSVNSSTRLRLITL